MTDREMLEFAAKAAGMDYLIWTTGAAPRVPREHRIGDRIFWHPRDDDGDALRLAVKLRIGVLHRSSGIEAHTFRSCLIICNEECAEGFDYYAATRRAIFRVAVEIGRNMT